MDFTTDEGRQFCASNDKAELVVMLRLAEDGSNTDLFVRGLDASKMVESFLTAYLYALFQRALAELGSITPPEGLTLRWACKLRDLANSCKRWPQDVGPTLHAALDKALTIELSKRKHAAAPSGAETAQVGLELAGAGLDLALKKLRVAGALIEFLRSTYSSPPFTDAQIEEITLLLCQWDKLKGK